MGPKEASEAVAVCGEELIAAALLNSGRMNTSLQTNGIRKIRKKGEKGVHGQPALRLI
jgi:hypothetical protein